MEAKPTIAELWQKKGMFVNSDTGEQIEKPADGFLVCAGDWPCRFIGARQVRCAFCNAFAGLSPKGWALHCEDKEKRPIACPACFENLLEMDRMTGVH